MSRRACTAAARTAALVLVLAAGACEPAPFDAVTVPQAAGGLLSVTFERSPSPVDLTALGDRDWVHYGYAPGMLVNRKLGARLISDLVYVSAPGQVPDVETYTDAFTSYSWRDGTPIASATAITRGVFVSRAGSGFELSVPADGSERVLVVHLGGWRARMRLEVTLSDGAAPPYVDDRTFQGIAQQFGLAARIAFRARGAGARVVMRYVMAEDFSSAPDPSGNASIEAARLE